MLERTFVLVLLILVLVLAAIVSAAIGASCADLFLREGGRPDPTGTAKTEETNYSTLQAHQMADVAEVFKCHFPAPKRIIDLTAHVGGDTVHFMKLYPEAVVTAVELNPATFAALTRNVETASGELHRAAGLTTLLNANGVDFLKTTDRKADFVYVDPPWGGPGYKKNKSMGLHLTDDAGDRWDSAEVAALALKNGTAPSAVLKVPFNFDFAAFDARVGYPTVTFPIGRPTRASKGVRPSYYLVVIGEAAEGGQK